FDLCDPSHQAIQLGRLYSLDKTARPCNFDAVNSRYFAQSEMDDQHRFRSVPGTRLYLPRHRLAARGQPHLAPDRIPIAALPNQLDLDGVAYFPQVVHVYRRCLVVVVDHYVELTVTIKIRYGNSAAVFDRIGPEWARYIYELAIPGIGKEAFTFITIP